MMDTSEQHWHIKPFERGLNYIDEMFRILHLSLRGLGMATSMPEMLRAVMLARGVQESSPSAARRLSAVESDAQFARDQLESGVPLLHAHAVVALWGVLESVIEDFLVAWLVNVPESLRIEQVAKVKIPLVEYETLDREDRMRLLLQELEHSLNSAHRPGIARFESLLDPFGMAGAVDDVLKKRLFEMYHVRNVIVHRGSVADRRLVEACPWLGLKIGNTIIISHAQSGVYGNAVGTYLARVIERMTERLRAIKAARSVVS